MKIRLTNSDPRAAGGCPVALIYSENGELEICACDPDSVVETEDGPMLARDLVMLLADRVVEDEPGLCERFLGGSVFD